MSAKRDIMEERCIYSSLSSPMLYAEDLMLVGKSLSLAYMHTHLLHLTSESIEALFSPFATIFSTEINNYTAFIDIFPFFCLFLMFLILLSTHNIVFGWLIPLPAYRRFLTTLQQTTFENVMTK